VQPHTDGPRAQACSLLEAARLVRIAGVLLILLGALALSISLLNALGPAPSGGLSLLFLGGGGVFGLLGGALLLAVTKGSSLHARSGQARREREGEHRIQTRQ
jgi:hypothetical protein